MFSQRNNPYCDLLQIVPKYNKKGRNSKMSQKNSSFDEKDFDMMQKRILGLDLGPNSIGWAVVNAIVSEDHETVLTGIEAVSYGSKILI